jgi:hypothetical protein
MPSPPASQSVAECSLRASYRRQLATPPRVACPALNLLNRAGPPRGTLALDGLHKVDGIAVLSTADCELPSIANCRTPTCGEPKESGSAYFVPAGLIQLGSCISSLELPTKSPTRPDFLLTTGTIGFDATPNPYAIDVP